MLSITHPVPASRRREIIRTIEAVIDDFYASIERNDFHALRSLYADDFKGWRSFDQVTQGKEEQLATMAALRARWALKYVVIERHYDRERLAQRHELTTSEHDGTIVHRLQVAVFVTVRNDQVYALSEYLDSRDVAALAAGMTDGASS